VFWGIRSEVGYFTGVPSGARRGADTMRQYAQRHRSGHRQENNWIRAAIFQFF